MRLTLFSRSARTEQRSPGINQRITTPLGYLVDQLIGKPYSVLINNDDLGRAQVLFNSKYKSTRHIELSLTSEAEKEGYPFPLTIMNMTFNPANTNLTENNVGTYVIARDLSEKKRAAEIIFYHKNADLLTCLPNRSPLTRKIDTELQRLRETNGGMMLLFVDLDRLNDLGVKIAIDDFGTGYSSLAYLRKFPIQIIKIDRSFVSEIQHDTSEFPVILAITSIARGLGMKLIAESVETPVQATYLKNRGCHIMQ